MPWTRYEESGDPPNLTIAEFKTLKKGWEIKLKLAQSMDLEPVEFKVLVPGQALSLIVVSGSRHLGYKRGIWFAEGVR